MHKDVEKIKDDLYIRKKKSGYIIVYPIKKDDSLPFRPGNIHWRNFLFGDMQMLGMGVLFLIAIGLLWLGTHDAVNNCEESITKLQGEEMSCAICDYHEYGGSNPFKGMNLSLNLNKGET